MRELFWKLTDQLVRHEVAEEVVVYPAVKELPGGTRLAEARTAEESQAEKLLATIEDLDPTSQDFIGALGELRAAVLEHAQKEEAEVFPLLLAHEPNERLLYLGQKFKGAKLAAPNHPHPHIPAGKHVSACHRADRGLLRPHAGRCPLLGLSLPVLRPPKMPRGRRRIS